MAQFDTERKTPDDLISIDAAQAELGVSRRTIYRLIESGELSKYRRVGDRKTYVSRSELREATGFRQA